MSCAPPVPGARRQIVSLSIRRTRRGFVTRARGADRRDTEKYIRQMMNWENFWEPGDENPERDVPEHRVAQFDARVIALEAERRRLAEKKRTG